MEWWQALIFAVVGWMSSLLGEGLLGIFGGWQCVGKPLIAGTIIGLVMGDVRTGILMGAAIQTMYIGLVTPGGAMPGDVNLAGWIGIPLAIAAKASPEYALSLAIPLSFLGVTLNYLVCSFNSIWVHKQSKLVADGDVKGAALMAPLSGVFNFIVRFGLIFVSCLFGADALTWLVENMPAWLGSAFSLLGKMLPAVGFALLLTFLVKKKMTLIYFFVGFVFLRVIGIGIVPCTIIALFLAYIDFIYNSKKVAVAGAANNDGEDE